MKVIFSLPKDNLSLDTTIILWPMRPCFRTGFTLYKRLEYQIGAASHAVSINYRWQTRLTPVVCTCLHRYVVVITVVQYLLHVFSIFRLVLQQFVQTKHDNVYIYVVLASGQGVK